MFFVGGGLSLEGVVGGGGGEGGVGGGGGEVEGELEEGV